ncbi:CIA30 family protein [Shewanella avicenniae]|uniref:CIA30 family protein n=1 Tax=Shewanella avicenniae TaxID=2814294 RepID=A0ABX7QMA1_9GAMM|nr:amidohydrolase family protein [Shewanella avicenniae]QSX32577.1 CIA30 family protein [Shewanella avicenniae]
MKCSQYWMGILSIASSISPLGGAVAADTLFNDVTVFDGTGKQPFVADVLVKDGKIATIAKQIQATTDAEVIEAKNFTLMPGLIDVHTHWTASRAEISTAMLTHGITTVTDYHSSPDSYAAKREWHKSLISPHVLYAARIAPPGGHGADWADEKMTRLVASKEEAKAVLEYLDQYQPDFIKVFADGWRYGNPEENTDISLDAFEGIVEQAKIRHLPVVTHTVTVDGGIKAAKAGVTAIVHAMQDEKADARLVELMKQKAVYYAPTLAVYEPRPEKVKKLNPEKLAQTNERQGFSKYNLGLLHDAGIKLGLGTDSGISKTPFGESSVRELELLVDFGISPAEALVAGTKGSAEIIGVDQVTGTIEVGKRADLLLIEGKPWKQISDIRNLKAVWVDGKPVVKDGALVGQQGPSVPPAIKIGAVIDDFEQGALTSLASVRKTNIDYGFPRSTILMQPKLKSVTESNHVLDVMVALENKNAPYAQLVFPLTPGGFVPVDASRYTGVSFSVNGNARNYTVVLDSYNGKSKATLEAISGWQTIVVPFSKFEGDWDKTSLTAVSIEVDGKAEEQYWIELDNVKFTE